MQLFQSGPFCAFLLLLSFSYCLQLLPAVVLLLSQRGEALRLAYARVQELLRGWVDEPHLQGLCSMTDIADLMLSEFLCVENSKQQQCFFATKQHVGWCAACKRAEQAIYAVSPPLPK